MKISLFGTGYVGLVAGTCLANLGNDVICVDIDEEKINKLNQGIIPIYEPGLSELIETNVKHGRLNFTTDAKKGVEASEVIFLAVGTPCDEEGCANLKYVFEVAETIGKYMNGYKVIVNKSTVPVGTGDLVKQKIKETQKNKHDFDVVSNPEFLREGEAVNDFLNPDRIVVGVENDRAKKIMIKIYSALERADKPILVTDIRSAEMIKYASNGFLATKISFINEIARVCEKVGADVKLVSRGMGLDRRIGPRFLQAGVGYGGSCFPKDVKALIATAKKNSVEMSILNAVEKVNYEQKRHVIPKIQKLLPDLKGKTIAVWGLAFKPKTDDMREAPSIVAIDELQKLGAKIKAFDPVAKETASKIFKDITYGEDPYDAIKGADLLLILTEWNEFRYLDKSKMKELMKQPNVVDGRNVFEKAEMEEAGFRYIGVGR